MDAIEGLITQLKNKIVEEELCGNTVNVLTEKLRLAIEQVESLENQILKLSSAHSDQKYDLREIRIKISDKLSTLHESFHIRSLKDIHILNDLWKLGFTGFHIRFECSIGPTEAMEKMLKCGGQHSFEDWRTEYVQMSEEELETEMNYFTAELEEERGKGDAGLAYRKMLLTRTVTSLEAEKDRRLHKETRTEVKRISRKRPKMTREKPDHWRYTK